MIERIEGTPDGVTALRSSGKLSKEDYVDVLEPAIDAAVASGELRMVFVIDDFDGLGEGAWVEDMKTGGRAWIRDHAAWKRFALVTDVEWIARAMRAFAWMAPGEVEVYPRSGEAEAIAWVAG